MCWAGAFLATADSEVTQLSGKEDTGSKQTCKQVSGGERGCMRFTVECIFETDRETT